MKRTGNIIILFVFCFYSLVFKTHYCYHINTDIRFHGDCNHEILQAKAKSQIANFNFFPNHYQCDNYYKDAKPDLSKSITVKHFTDITAIINSNVTTYIYQHKAIDWIFPEIQSRGGPPLIINYLRGPPLA